MSLGEEKALTLDNTLPPDPRVDAERRVSVVALEQGGPFAGRLHYRGPVSELCARAGYHVNDGAARGQGCRARRRYCQLGVGLVLCRHAAV